MRKGVSRQRATGRRPTLPIEPSGSPQPCGARKALSRAAKERDASDFLPFILQTLEKFPTLTASRLYLMVRERGYGGGADHFRHIISCHPRPKAEAYLRLRTLAGEQAKADWGHFGRVSINRAVRTLMAFVMVLSYSRDILLHFFLNACIENFLRGHVEAFSAWGGVPRAVLYDNLKSVVLVALIVTSECRKF